MTTDPQSYRRSHPVTKVTARVVVQTVVGLRRRINWRLRELSIQADRRVTFIERLEAVGYHGGKSSIWHIIRKTELRGSIPSGTFDMLTAALKMDEVDGWGRPWPTLPPAAKRRSLADIVTDGLAGEEPGKE